MQIVVLVLTVVGVQYTISWVGNCLMDMCSGQIKYAYFYFSKDRNIPMTKNILMNIFIPNIVMVFLYDLYKYIGWEYLASKMWIFTICFYLWRCILICVILRRREFYKLKYELSMALISIFISIILFYSFLVKTDSIFIKPDELREELGFAIIVIIYGFIKLVFDEKITQKTILKENDLNKYIYRKFNIFYKRYKKIVNIDAENSTIWILLFSIMIMEDFNRGPEKRAVEYIFFPIKKKETLGIMQVNSKRYISSKKSIQLAFTLINEYKKKLNIDVISAVNVYDIAFEYNEDERYGENVRYIYEVLERYIKGSDYYQKKFCIVMQNDLEKIIENEDKIVCRTLRELAESLSDNSCFILQRQVSDILNGLIDTKYLQIEEAGDGWEVVFKGLNNVKIYGDGSHMFSHFKEANVISFEKCNNVEFEGFKLGHKTEVEECCGAVIYISNSQNIFFRNMDLYGCGTYGVFSSDSSVGLKNVNIHNCKNGALYACRSDIEIEDGCIYNCEEEIRDLIEVEGNLKVRNLEIYNNRANLAIINSNPERTELRKVYIHDNMYRKNYFWSATDSEVILKNNKHLSWN